MIDNLFIYLVFNLFCYRSTIYTPKVVDENRAHKLQETQDSTKQLEERYPAEDINNNSNNNENCKEEQGTNGRIDDESDEEPNLIPWRAQLRKTNSKLNLLD